MSASASNQDYDEAPREIVTETIVWRGVAISVTYEADWMGRSEDPSDYAMAHVTVTVLSPEGAPLPVTETGYRSHFLPPGIVEEAGGPSAFALAWLDNTATGRAWERAHAKWNQRDLFG